LEGAFPLVRILLNVLAREIITAGTRVDMLRGVPVIYTCYIGYDVVGHHSGPISRNALRVLRGIDGAFGRLLDTRAWARRRYNVVVLSDHGMSGCQPVAEAFDHDFEAWVEGWWRQGVQATPQYQIDRRRVRRRLRRSARRRRGSLISRIAGGVARRGSGFFRTWGRIGAWVLEIGSSGAIKLGDRFFQAEGEDRQTRRLAVIACGPLVQLWVRDVGRRLQEHEVEALCPGFVRALVDHPAVECVIAKEGDEVVVHGRFGTAYLGATGGVGEGAAPAVPDGVSLRVAGRNPLEIYEEPDVVARQIASFASMEACGDLICFAASFQPDSLRDATPGAAGERHVYTFENQLGTHASVGGDQGYPFIMLHHSVPFDPSAIVEAADLYPFLDAYVHGDHRAGALKALKPRGRARAGEDLPVPSTTAC
jgi:Type I phosphodiesterase / nucleotide pyrophosphatase